MDTLLRDHESLERREDRHEIVKRIKQDQHALRMKASRTRDENVHVGAMGIYLLHLQALGLGQLPAHAQVLNHASLSHATYTDFVALGLPDAPNVHRLESDLLGNQLWWFDIQRSLSRP